MPADATPHDEPDYLTPIDAYAGQALNGMLAQGGFPHETESLAKQAFGLARAMAVERTKYFQQYPVAPPDERSPLVRYQQMRDELRNLDYSQLSVDHIHKLFARHNREGLAFASYSEACAAVPLGERYPGLQVQVGAPEVYAWWPTTDLTDAALVPVLPTGPTDEERRSYQGSS